MLGGHIHFLPASARTTQDDLSAASAFITMSEHEGYCVPGGDIRAADPPMPILSGDAGSAGRRFHQKNFMLTADVHSTFALPGSESMIMTQHAREKLAAAADGRTIWSA
jgi:hypothetical protein